MPRRKTDDTSRAECVRGWLEQQIRNGAYAPGDRINEQDICARFEISRTPVREALLQLATLNLVTFQPRHGAVVTRLTVREIVAMWETLTCLEGFCAGLAARRMTEQELKELKLVHGEARSYVDGCDTAGYANANQAFHEIIYCASKNDYLSGHVRHIRSRLQAYRRYPFNRAGGLERSIAGHDAVVRALEAGDDAAASAAMNEHVASAMSFVDLIAEIPEEANTRAALRNHGSGGRNTTRRPSKASSNIKRSAISPKARFIDCS